MKYKLVNYCEFDKYAAKAYSLIHNVSENLNLGDITKVDEKQILDFNMMVGGSPCQDFSVAGKQEGAKWTCKDCSHGYNPLEAHYTIRDECPKCNSINIEKTRSSLLVEWLRILREKKPNFAIYENVKNIIGRQFKPTFELFEKELNEYGYNTYYEILNAIDYGVPQNRERVFLVIIKKELDNCKFKFPNGFDRAIKLKDVLEKDVEEKFFSTLEFDIITPTISKSGLIQVGMIKNEKYHDFSRRIYSTEGIARNIMAGGGNLNDKAGQYLIDDRFRRLTPLECFRIMDFDDKDYYILKENKISDSQCYKMAGNSIVVGVLYYILLELYNTMPYLFEDLKIGSFFSGIGAFEKAIELLYKNIINK